MQIFVLENSPKAIARSLCDKHVLSQIGETAELLAIAHEHCREGVPPLARLKPRKYHINHPCAKWVSKTKGNYEWTVTLGLALCAEYTHRYGKDHAYHEDITRMMHAPFKLLAGKKGLTQHPTVVPDEYINDDSVIQTYRHYYHYKAQRMNMRWTRRMSPAWFRGNEGISFVGQRAYP